MEVKNHGLAVHSRAIGMIQAGMTQKKVATELHVSLRSIERWWRELISLGNLKKPSLVVGGRNC